MAKSLKKHLLIILLAGFILLFVMLMIQSLSGKYGSQIYIPWLWISILFIPLLIILFKVKKAAFHSNGLLLKSLAILFVIACLATIFSQRMVASNMGPPIYKGFTYTLKMSMLFLVPLELLMLYFLRKSMIFIDPKEVIKDPKVFISYNHNDKTEALKVKAAIEQANIPVIIDQENMLAGTDINEFIQESIKEATVVVSLVSNRSLKSAWVAKETTDTLFLESYGEDIQLIACYLDNDFFKNGYTLKAVQEINIHIEEIQNLAEQYHDEGIDTRDLNEQKTRLIKLRNNMDGIIGRLKSSLCLDIRDDQFSKSMEALVEAILADE